MEFFVIPCDIETMDFIPQGAKEDYERPGYSSIDNPKLFSAGKFKNLEDVFHYYCPDCYERESDNSKNYCIYKGYDLIKTIPLGDSIAIYKTAFKIPDNNPELDIIVGYTADDGEAYYFGIMVI